ncbi:MAG: phospho-N-acetylmuramoyl-pentapeptide-transferase [Gammaproteobacteria bacterium]|jgi:phospho-N-acetylmuramoyl-pentapeptide-transferase|nr:phospho-N-acetylmuramoyl-pentapeptide-transferase [Gammaproteobacteria bacterium]
MLSFGIAFLVMLIFGNQFIRLLQKWQAGQVIRKEGPESHYSKKGTPTMGGILIMIAITAAVLLSGGWRFNLVWMGLLTLWLFAAIGFLDDYKKLILKHSKGLASRWKYFWQSVFSLALAFWFQHYFNSIGEMPALILPFTHQVLILRPISFIVLAYFVLTGSSNAVNLTDGLDGLAILSIMLVAVGFSFFTMMSGHPETQGLLLICFAIMGAGLGFWWFNGFPAGLFMGDVGSLALGALLGFLAIALQAELAWLIMGGIFVIETLSVILQVGSYKLRKKRIFKMAPIHHHFELGGLTEPKIVTRFSIVTLLLVIFTVYGFLHG